MNLVELQKKSLQEAEEKENVSPKELGKKLEDKKEEFAKRIETFNLKYTEDEGKELSTVLRSKIMDYDSRLRYDRILSELSAGMNFDNLPFETKNRYICIARAICQLIDPPEWVLNKIGEDLELCYNIGGKLIDHETRFFRYANTENKEGQGRARFQLS